MATFNISIPGLICCYEKGGTMISPGEVIRLTLDDGKFPNIATNPIDAVVNSMTEAQVRDPETNTKVAGYIYNVTVDDNQMPTVNGAVLTELDICDVVDWACKSCCDALSDRLDDVENATGTTYWIEGAVEPDSEPNLGQVTPVIGDTVMQKTSANVYEFWTYTSEGWRKDHSIDIEAITNGSFSVTSGTSADDVSGGSATVSPGSVLHLWSAGGLSFQTVPGSATVRVEPENLSVDFATSGAPVGTPDDQTRTAVHFASDGLYFWDTTAAIWRRLASPTVKVHTATTVADLNGLASVVSDGDLVITQGYYAESDGGGNKYRYDLGSADTCDGGFTLDGLGGDNTPAGINVTYAGTGLGRFIATDQTVANAKQFGAKGDGVTDDTARLQASLDSSTQIIVSRGVYEYESLTVAQDNTSIKIESGGELRQILLSGFGITVTGDKCLVFGGGAVSSKVQSLGDYDTLGSGITRSIIKVNGEDFTVKNISINTPSRCGIFAENVKTVTLDGVRGDGGYLLADYNPATTLNLYAVFMDPADSRSTLNVHNCEFKRFISPVATGEIGGGSGISSGSQVIGCRFTSCYDHAAYMLNSEGVLIKGNYCEDVRKPFAVDGEGALIVENVSISTGTSETYHENGFSLRDCSNAIVSGNYLEGVGAYIDLGASVPEDITGCQITDNILISTAESSELAASIRITSTASLCNANRVSGNRIHNVSEASGSLGVITVSGASGFRASNNLIESNVVTVGADATIIYCNYCDDSTVAKNILDRSGYDAGAPLTVTGIFFNNSENPLVEGNEHRYTSGGVNVTANGVTIDASSNNAVIRGERNAMTSGSLVLDRLINNSGTNGVRIRNHYDLTQPLNGVVTLGSGVGSVIVNNNNVQSGSRIFISPSDAGSASQQSDSTHQGVYASEEAVSSRFRLITGTGAATTSAGVWFWEIDG